uniref:MADS-box domain-containing protein n=1 Tax=Salix viminalis TaxID=40686 RepID=A0A6N2LZN4_SALVM
MIVNFSPAQEAFCSGHPNIGSIMDRFLTGNPSPSSPDAHQLIEMPELGADLEIDTASTTLNHFNNFGYAYGIC